MPDRHELLLELQVLGALAVFTFLVAAGWHLLAGRNTSLLPPQRHRCVPWGGREVAAAVFLYLIFWHALWNDVLERTGFFNLVRGPVTTSSVPAADTGKDEDSKREMTRKSIWVQAFAFPFQLVSIVWLLRQLCGARLYQFGLTLRRAGRDAVLGCVAWLILTPLVYGLFAVVMACYVFVLKKPPEEHPVVLPLRGDSAWFEVAVTVFVVLVAAPVSEEFFFRGVLQPWLCCRAWGGNAAMTASFGLAFYIWSVNRSVGPAWLVIALLPGYFLVEWIAWRLLPLPHVARAIYGTSLLFALMHSTVWPTPIPLFVLGLGLGYLAYRTQSLVPPIVLHSLFNGVTCVTLLLT